jgi:16S rRNA (guanine(966)-N(2))-methyltransferase RsmD
MRIVSGKYKRRRFEAPRSLRLRPTTDFAKENLFNILSNRIDWEEATALDLFAGTGSIGFEFLSRGCREVICVEKEATHCAFIRKVKDALEDRQLQVVKSDVFRFIETCNRSFDVVFADPPYALPELEQIPALIFHHPLVKDGGWLILEHPKEYDFSTFPGFEERRVYGAVNFSLIRGGAIL